MHCWLNLVLADHRLHAGGPKEGKLLSLLWQSWKWRHAIPGLINWIVIFVTAGIALLYVLQYMTFKLSLPYLIHSFKVHTWAQYGWNEYFPGRCTANTTVLSNLESNVDPAAFHLGPCMYFLVSQSVVFATYHYRKQLTSSCPQKKCLKVPNKAL